MYTKMDDKEFINLLWKILWGLFSDGDYPTQDEWEILRLELTDRGIIEGEFPA